MTTIPGRGRYGVADLNRTSAQILRTAMLEVMAGAPGSIHDVMNRLHQRGREWLWVRYGHVESAMATLTRQGHIAIMPRPVKVGRMAANGHPGELRWCVVREGVKA